MWVSSGFLQEHASRWVDWLWQIILRCEIVFHCMCVGFMWVCARIHWFWKKTVLKKSWRDAPGCQMLGRSIVCCLLPIQEMIIDLIIELRQNVWHKKMTVCISGENPQWPPEGDGGVLLHIDSDLISKLHHVYQVENPFNIWWRDDFMDARRVLGWILKKTASRVLQHYGLTDRHTVKTQVFLYRD